MAVKLQAILALIKTTFAEWNEDKAPQLAASLAYYTVFSLAPLLIIVIAVVGLVFGREAAQNQIVIQIQGVVGKNGAELIQSMIENASKPGVGIFATILGIVTLLLGAAGVFGQLKGALNTFWDVPPKKSAGGLKDIFNAIRQQFISFTMVLGTGFLLLVSFILSAALSALINYLGTYVSMVASIGELCNFVVSFFVITLLFAAIYKVLPDTKISWRDVWIGAMATTLLFVIGKWLIGLYLGHTSVTSIYGAAGALVLILLWVNYSAQILFLGAEFTQVYTRTHGTHATNGRIAPVHTEKAAKVAQHYPEKASLRMPEPPNRTQESVVMISRVVGILVPAIVLCIRIWQITRYIMNLGQEPEDLKQNYH